MVNVVLTDIGHCGGFKCKVFIEENGREGLERHLMLDNLRGIKHEADTEFS
ncbi:hypothetical protein VCRA2119O147_6070002 [Vibrio crassostreae]|nr:hypothetical protein VCRA2118O41_140031 [Vibrio crassostreae]CAK1784129.1 hypothetical protein VCRA2117O39_150093 [Vibrio crassostreae]CAK1784177.1 hypothetical protein VCRA2113O20_150093 [Vibrio crassostreae]CAK1796963.1 hypothetical protein VCRA2113O120_160095 [Vibrio crassostreae]CAK1801154.1 hypothetical protein VCRA2119O45_160031 [Vibrio crassostreae]